MTRLGLARQGSARRGVAGLGKGCNQRTPDLKKSGFRWRHQRAWPGEARQGVAWPGVARLGKGAMRKREQNFMNKTHFSKDGLPTAPDVAALEKHYATLQIGDQLPYEDIEALLGVEWNTQRFRTITRVWRIRERK